MLLFSGSCCFTTSLACYVVVIIGFAPFRDVIGMLCGRYYWVRTISRRHWHAMWSLLLGSRHFTTSLACYVVAIIGFAPFHDVIGMLCGRYYWVRAISRRHWHAMWSLLLGSRHFTTSSARDVAAIIGFAPFHDVIGTLCGRYYWVRTISRRHWHAMWSLLLGSHHFATSLACYVVAIIGFAPFHDVIGTL